MNQNNPRINPLPFRQKNKNDDDPLTQFANLNGEFASIPGIRDALKIFSDPVSYTHLTLPTIYSV